MAQLVSHSSFCILVSLLLCEFPFGQPQNSTTIVFSSTSHSHTHFDIFASRVPVHNLSSSSGSWLTSLVSRPEFRLTDGVSLNYNGQFVAYSDVQDIESELGAEERNGDIVLAYVSERDGAPQIYLDFLDSIKLTGSRDGARTTRKLKRTDFFQDRPSVRSGWAVFAGMRDPNPSNVPSSAEVHRASWAAIYSTKMSTGETTCLSPEGVADFSPSVSPSGMWVIVASDQGKGFNGELCGIHSDLYIFKATDPSKRRLLLKDGGWPSWTSEATFFFHRRDAEDGWWSVYEVNLEDDPWSLPVRGFPQEKIKRITPVGVHAFTPAASRTGKWIAVATRRPGTHFRHIEILDLETKKFIEVTASVAPQTHHYNPFVSDDLSMVGYHRCRYATVTSRFKDIAERSRHLESHKQLHTLRSPLPDISLLRIDGDFPSFSPDGSMIAFNPNVNSAYASHVDVINVDGTNRRRMFEGSVEGTTRKAFGTAWDRKEKGVVYTAVGEDIFMVATAPVHLCRLRMGGGNTSNKCNTSKNGRLLVPEVNVNNAFPSPSPDGRELVFRSSGDRPFFFNLYIMSLDAENRQRPRVRRLTEGEWTDTMCTWSPDGEWIAFASDREKPGGGSYSTYLIRPDGSGLRRVVSRNALHPQFSPDSRSIAVTTDYGGLSAEPISMPNEFQPYGEVYVVRMRNEELDRSEDAEFEDGRKLLLTERLRLTFGPYENALGAWGSQNGEENGRTPVPQKAADHEELKCSYSDVFWLTSKRRECQFCNPALLIERS